MKDSLRMIQAFAAALLMAMGAVGAVQAGETVKLELGGGIVISPDYADTLDDVYRNADVSAAGWVSLQGGARVHITDHFSLTPGVALYFNYVVVDGGSQDEDYANYIIIPYLVARYFFTAEPGFYIGGGPNLNIPDTGSDYYELDSDGVGFEAFVGYSPSERTNIEIGYSHVPVEVIGRSENFGGLIARFVADL